MYNLVLVLLLYKSNFDFRASLLLMLSPLLELREKIKAKLFLQKCKKKQRINIKSLFELIMIKKVHEKNILLSVHIFIHGYHKRKGGGREF